MTNPTIEHFSVGLGISDDAFDRLIRDKSTPKITLLMPPRPPGHPIAEDETRLRSLVTSAVRRLTESGVEEKTAKHMFAGLLEGVDHSGPDSTNSRAIFISEEQRTVVTVPIELGERVLMGDNFALTPLAPLVKPARFVVVALNRAGVDAALATRFGYEPLELPGAPSGLAELTQYSDIERQLQSHSVGGGGQSFHGHGGMENKESEDLHRYAGMVEAAVEKAVGDGIRAHTVFGPPALVAEYRKAVSSSAIDVYPITTNPSSAGLDELHKRAAAELGDTVSRTTNAVSLYNRVAGSDKCVRDLATITDAASQGKIHALLFNTNWFTDNDPDVIEGAAVETWRNSGEVHQTDKVEGGAAVLRY